MIRHLKSTSRKIFFNSNEEKYYQLSCKTIETNSDKFHLLITIGLMSSGVVVFMR